MKITHNQILACIQQSSKDDSIKFSKSVEVEEIGHISILELSSSLKTGINGTFVFRSSLTSEITQRQVLLIKYLTKCGFALPKLILSGSADDELIGNWYMTEFVESSFNNLDQKQPYKFFKSLNSILNRPVLIAKLLAELHSIDITNLVDQIEFESNSFDWHEFLWTRAKGIEGAGIDDVLRWLEKNEPKCMELCITHGDITSANILIGPDGPKIIDWEIAGLAPASRDVACAYLSISSIGSNGPKPARPVFSFIGNKLSNRFLKKYQKEIGHSLDLSELLWHQVLYSMNRLFWAARNINIEMSENGFTSVENSTKSFALIDASQCPFDVDLIKEITGISIEGKIKCLTPDI